MMLTLASDSTFRPVLARLGLKVNSENGWVGLGSCRLHHITGKTDTVIDNHSSNQMVFHNQGVWNTTLMTISIPITFVGGR